jgi:hypothetical protein
MSIIPSATNCSVTSCSACPAPLIGPLDSGFPVGCKSACDANLDGNPCACAACSLSSRLTHFSRSLFGELVQLLHWHVQHPSDLPALGCGVLLLLQCAFRSSKKLQQTLMIAETNYPDVYSTALWTFDSSLNSYYTLAFCPCIFSLFFPPLIHT